MAKTKAIKRVRLEKWEKHFMNRVDLTFTRVYHGEMFFKSWPNPTSLQSTRSAFDLARVNHDEAISGNLTLTKYCNQNTQVAAPRAVQKFLTYVIEVEKITSWILSILIDFRMNWKRSKFLSVSINMFNK